MTAAKNPTRRFLIIMAAVFFFGTLSNAYFLFRPSPYDHRHFDAGSARDWLVVAVNLLFIIYFYFILKNAASIFSRIYWLALLAVFASGFLEKYVIRFSPFASQLFATTACAVICLLSLQFLYLHRRYGFSLFTGLTYRIWIRRQ